jgi:hypothetical protein
VSGAITTDDSGNANTLTNMGVATTTKHAFEGDDAAETELSSSQYLKRTDGDLSANFPLKVGDADKIFSACFWFQWETVPGAGVYAFLLSKYFHTTDKRCFAIGGYNSLLYVFNGYNAGVNVETWNTTVAPVAGRVYHVGVVHDGVNKTCKVRIWSEHDGAVNEYTTNWTNETSLCDIPFCIGADGNGARLADAIIDEVVVFNRILTSAEIDQIRTGEYVGWKPDEMVGVSVVDEPEWGSVNTYSLMFLLF